MSDQVNLDCDGETRAEDFARREVDARVRTLFEAIATLQERVAVLESKLAEMGTP